MPTKQFVKNKYTKIADSTLTLQRCLGFISTGEIHEYQDEIEMELEQSRPKLRGMYASCAKAGTTLRGPAALSSHASSLVRTPWGGGVCVCISLCYQSVARA